MAISGIAAVSSCIGSYFTPFVDNIFLLLKELVSITDPNRIELRCRAIEAAGFILLSNLNLWFPGVISLAIGKEAARPYINFFIENAVQGFNTPGLEELHEWTIRF